MATVTIHSDFRAQEEEICANLHSILKIMDVILLRTNQSVPVVKAMVFPVVMYGCESRTIKKAES